MQLKTLSASLLKTSDNEVIFCIHCISIHTAWSIPWSLTNPFKTISENRYASWQTKKPTNAHINVILSQDHAPWQTKKTTQDSASTKTCWVPQRVNNKKNNTHRMLLVPCFYLPCNQRLCTDRVSTVFCNCHISWSERTIASTIASTMHQRHKTTNVAEDAWCGRRDTIANNCACPTMVSILSLLAKTPDAHSLLNWKCALSAKVTLQTRAQSYLLPWCRIVSQSKKLCQEHLRASEPLPITNSTIFVQRRHK